MRKIILVAGAVLTLGVLAAPQAEAKPWHGGHGGWHGGGHGWHGGFNRGRHRGWYKGTPWGPPGHYRRFSGPRHYYGAPRRYYGW